MTEDSRAGIAVLDGGRDAPIAPRFRGSRGETAVDREELCRTVSRFSAIAASCGETVTEIDVNPIIAGEWGCVAVDALLINKNQQEKRE